MPNKGKDKYSPTKTEKSILNKLSEFYEYVKESSVYKVLTSKALSRVYAVVFGVLVLAGVAAASIPAAVVGIAAVLIGAVVDTVTLTGTRRLKKEDELLTKNRSAKSKQDFLLKMEPKVADALKGHLYQPEREGKKSIADRYIKPGSDRKATATDFGKAVLKNILDAGASIIEAISAKNLLGIIKTAAEAGKEIYSESQENFKISGKRHEFKKQIDQEREKPDTPGYNNIRELRVSTREQRIQAMAIQELVKRGDYRVSTPEQIVDQYAKIKSEIESKEEAIKAPRNPVLKALRTFGKDLLRAHNPFNDLNDPEKLKVAEPSKLAKGMMKHEKNESVLQQEANKELISEIKSKGLPSAAKTLPKKEAVKSKSGNHGRNSFS